MSTIRSVEKVQEELTAKSAQLHKIFNDAKSEEGLKLDAEQLDGINDRNDELSVLGTELIEAKKLERIANLAEQNVADGAIAAKQLPMGGNRAPADPRYPAMPQPQKSLGELFTDSKQYKNRERGELATVKFNDFDPQRFGRKTLVSTTAGFAPETLRTGLVVPSAQRIPMVSDLIPQTTTQQAAVVYMEETTFTNNAAEVAEGGTYAESALAWTQRSQPIEKIGTTIPVTDEQVDDVPQMQSLINNRLGFMVLLRRDSQLLQGDGISPNLEGFYNKTGIQTQAKGGDTTQDALYKALTLVRHTGFANPTAFILHPNDWQDIRLTTTVDGLYIWGNPSEQGVERVWGLPVVNTTAATENTGLTGDFQLYSEISFKQGTVIKISDSHGTTFVEGTLTVRADERLALAIYRAAAFCTITGI